MKGWVFTWGLSDKSESQRIWESEFHTPDTVLLKARPPVEVRECEEFPFSQPQSERWDTQVKDLIRVTDWENPAHGEVWIFCTIYGSENHGNVFLLHECRAFEITPKN